MTEQDELYALIDRYNGMIEPIESWATADVSALIRLLDAELQRRYDDVQHFIKGLDTLEEFDDEDFG
jgi:hypothetical protein